MVLYDEKPMVNEGATDLQGIEIAKHFCEALYHGNPARPRVAKL